MNKWKIWIVLSMFFISGMAVGAVGSTLFTQYRIKHMFSSGPPFPEKRLARHLMETLDLSPEEAKRTKIIFDQLGNDLRNLRDKTHPLITAIFDKAKTELKQSLPKERHAQIDKAMSPPNHPPFAPPPPPPF
ncbi:MAG: hypothetical protein PHO79_04780 [Desulfoplanes sp.]|nr:hypothetical protein [Desulfoplanes sp.]MDD4649315.1 hypothetical protein [Desulfoplanes sp.]